MPKLHNTNAFNVCVCMQAYKQSRTLAPIRLFHSDLGDHEIGTIVMGHSFIRSRVRSHRSLVCLLRTARFACALCCAHSFARSLLSSWDSEISLFDFEGVPNHCIPHSSLPFSPASKGDFSSTRPYYEATFPPDDASRRCGVNLVTSDAANADSAWWVERL